MSLEEYRDEEAERKTSLQTGLPRRWCNVGSGALRSAAKASLRPRPPTHAHLLFDEPPLLEELPVLRQHALLGLHRHLRETRGGGGCRNKVLVPARATRTLLRGDFLNDASDRMWRQKKLQLQKVTGCSTLAAH